VRLGGPDNLADFARGRDDGRASHAWFEALDSGSGPSETSLGAISGFSDQRILGI
jgi:hypothetical protein